MLELLMTLVMPTNVGDYVDTGWDLVFDLVGAGAVGVWLAMYRRPSAQLEPLGCDPGADG